MPPQCIHGTRFELWPSIRAEGLSRMKRQHVHMAPGMPHNNEVRILLEPTAIKFLTRAGHLWHEAIVRLNHSCRHLASSRRWYGLLSLLQQRYSIAWRR